MLYTIFMFLFLPFTPIWLIDSAMENNQERVLGEYRVNNQEETEESVGYDNRNFQNNNLFPLGAPLAEYTPVRKEDYRDLVLWAGSSVAIDASSQTILHYDNGRQRTQIASLTKIMTAILVMENIDNLNEEVTITEEALLVPGTVVGCPTSVFCNANRMYRGEKVKVIDLLKAMLLNSANDAATALAIHIDGSVERFVERMNRRAREMGLKDSNFCTPSGLEIDGQEAECYSSAYDIARIAVYSLRYSLIWEIMRISEDRFYSCDGKYMHELKNTDILLETLPNCLGGKTGFTPLAGRSLLLGAEDPTRKHKIIAVVLNDENRWGDMRILVDWVFSNYEWR